MSKSLQRTLTICAKFTRRAAQMNNRVDMDQPFNFGRLNKMETEALDIVHYLTVSTLMMALSRLIGRYTLDSFGCDLQLVCVLGQEQPKV